MTAEPPAQIEHAPYAFSFWNAGDVPQTIDRAKSHPCWALALLLAADALDGRLPDITGGANYFYNPKLANPSWAKSMRQTAAIGAHVFLTDR
jgi:spore germination cell wall hydrolase CwlJ-like protein